MAEIKYVEMTVMNENHMPEGIKSRLNLRNYCCFLVQNVLFYHLLLKNVNIRVIKSNRTRCSGHVVCMGGDKIHETFLSEGLK